MCSALDNDCVGLHVLSHAHVDGKAKTHLLASSTPRVGRSSEQQQQRVFDMLLKGLKPLRADGAIDDAVVGGQ